MATAEKPVISTYRSRMDKAVAALKEEFASLRTGRSTDGWATTSRQATSQSTSNANSTAINRRSSRNHEGRPRRETRPGREHENTRRTPVPGTGSA